MPKAKRPPVPIITEDELRSVIASVAMECGPFTAEELANFEKIASGEMTTGEYRAAILAEIEQESRKKQRK